MTIRQSREAVQQRHNTIRLGLLGFVWLGTMFLLGQFGVFG